MRGRDIRQIERERMREGEKWDRDTERDRKRRVREISRETEPQCHSRTKMSTPELAFVPK